MIKKGSYIIYDDGTNYWWKVYKVTKVNKTDYSYECLACSYSKANHDGRFAKISLVADEGRIVSKLDADAYILAKVL